MVNGTNGTRSRRLPTSAIMIALYQKFPAVHDLFAVEPDIEIATYAVDMGFRSPVCAGVFRVRMTKGDVDSGNFFILQDVADDMGASRVGADGKFPNAVAVFIGAGVSVKFIAQILVLRAQRADAIIFYFDCERIGFEIAKPFA